MDKKRKSLVGWTRKNWLQDFKEHNITHRIMHAEIHKTKSSYVCYSSVGYTIVKVRITIEELK